VSDQQVRCVKLPDFDPAKSNIKEGCEFVSASGVLDIERRHIKIESALFNFQDFIGVFKRENGASNFANVELDLAGLNGCEVEVKIKVLKFPSNHKGEDKKQ